MGVLRAAAALLAAFLPARYWPRLEALPVSAAAPVSGLATMIAGIAIGIDGFLAFAAGVMNATGKMQVDIAVRQNTGQVAVGGPETIAPMGVAMLAPVSFLFTPLGLFAAYLTITGFVRVLSWYVDSPIGDPILTGITGVTSRLTRGVKNTRARHARERREGAEVPDRLYTGEWAGLAGVDFVVVSSRRKPDWQRGTAVITQDRWFTLGVPFDMDTPDGLRVVYPLTAQLNTEVLRAGVAYDLPRLQRARSSAISSAASNAIAPPRSSPPDTAGRFK